jgi:hypothetical protein
LKLWVPKAIAVASMYNYYDFFESVLADLYSRSLRESKSLIEQHIFNIVFKIPNPDRIKSKIKYPLYVPLQGDAKSWIEL